MDKEITSLISEIQDLETSLRNQILLFNEKANIFLHTENFFKDQIILNFHKKIIKLNITDKDIEKLKYFIFMFNEINQEFKQEITKDNIFTPLEQINLSPGTNSEIIETFSHIRQITHKYFFLINQYFINSFSIKLIPKPNIQNIIKNNIYDFDYNDNQVSMLINTKNIKSKGEPDLKKIQNIEQNQNYFTKEISINSLLLKVIPIFQKEFSQKLFDEFFKIIIENSFSLLYKELFTFYYMQIYKNKINTKEVIENAKAKYSDIKRDLVSHINSEFLKNKNIIPKQFLEKNKNKLKIIIQFINSLDSKYIFDFSDPLIYEIKFRYSNQFEKIIYNSKISMEIYLNSIKTNQKFLTTSANIVYSIDNYEITSDMLDLKYYDQLIKNFKKFQINITKDQYNLINNLL